MDYREEMKQLRDFLNQQSYLYYVLDAPATSTLVKTHCHWVSATAAS